MSMQLNTVVGIEAMNVYCGIAQISVEVMFQGRGLDFKRMNNLGMQNRAINLPFEDPITNAVNAAKPIIDNLTADEVAQIEILVVASESGIDMSKSISSYVHRHLGLANTCRLLEVKQACFASTAAIQLAVGYLASGISSNAKVMVIGTDVAIVNARAEYMEPTVGAGSSALLLSNNPKIAQFDLGAFGLHSFEVLDSARPTAQHEIADVDGSLFVYLDCLSKSFENYKSKVTGADFLNTFNHLAFHTPFAGLVKSAHKKMLREAGIADVALVSEDFERRLTPSLHYPSMVGNLCSASVYLALASTIDHIHVNDVDRVGLFSYGSGCSSEFFSLLLSRDSKNHLKPMQIGDYLSARTELSFAEYESLLEENLQCLVPVENRQLAVSKYQHLLDRVSKRRKILVLDNITDYYRNYIWI
ncbi:hydroxymethylglutaryl-CoA synthase family protein [Endozoicomonas sp. G2_1]|uniref:hydroxymethylglutaryl-CoA synthase family protein n=1 Tax=Endozoicomonas sp. G2_1 TaxID=2821091 RepID=UPI001AD98229|nr:hydroxymethylglutaryl-CoA synthase family protein [Endozoicomonas sp. G2_1]MBO9489821.1 hydroxymethylglutaryl-CoA synthase family protein [Endozoicomonas sp. G2_1]